MKCPDRSQIISGDDTGEKGQSHGRLYHHSLDPQALGSFGEFRCQGSPRERGVENVLENITRECGQGGRAVRRGRSD